MLGIDPLFVLLIYLCMYIHTCQSHRTIPRNPFSPSATWFLGIELKSSGLITSSHIHWVILGGPELLPLNKISIYFFMPSILCTIIFDYHRLLKNFCSLNFDNISFPSLSETFRIFKNNSFDLHISLVQLSMWDTSEAMFNDAE